MDRNDPDRSSGDPETHDGAHVGSTDATDQGELSDAGREARRGKDGPQDGGTSLDSPDDATATSAG